MTERGSDWTRGDEPTRISQAKASRGSSAKHRGGDANLSTLLQSASESVATYREGLKAAALDPMASLVGKHPSPSSVAPRAALAELGAWVLERVEAGKTAQVIAALREHSGEASDRSAGGELPPPPTDAFDTEVPSPSGLFMTIERQQPTDYEGPRESLSDAQLQMLKKSGGPNLTSPNEQRMRRKERARADLAEWWSTLGPTPSPIDEAGARREVALLHDVVSHRLAEWEELPREYNHILTSWATKRLRSAQVVVAKEQPRLAEELERIEHGVRRLSRHSKLSQPGFVYGLGLDHTPERGTWIDDALHEEARVRAELGLEAPAHVASAAGLSEEPTDAYDVVEDPQ